MPLDYTLLSTLQSRNQLPSYTPEVNSTFWTAVCAIIHRMGALKKIQTGLSMYSFRSDIDDVVVLRPLIEIVKRFSKELLHIGCCVVILILDLEMLDTDLVDV